MRVEGIVLACTSPRCAFVPSCGGSPVFLMEDHPVGSFVDPVRGSGRIVYLPCGGCIACRRERRQELTLLQLCEASLHDENWFLTLTYDDWKTIQITGLPPYSLVRSHLSDFNESMRHYCRYNGFDWRFFACGEYGDLYERPHYHLSVFGLPSQVLGLPCFDDDDIIRMKGLNHGKISRLSSPLRDENGNEFWQSKVVSDRWPYGSHKIYRANRETFQYVAGYVTKKLRGDPGRDFKKTGRILPFLSQSRPSIGWPWFLKYFGSISNSDSQGNLVNDTLSVDDVDWKIPRIFSKWLSRIDHFDGPAISSRLSSLRSALAPLVPDRFELKRKRDFDKYGACQHKQNNKHREVK